jgi:hypothetical protein
MLKQKQELRLGKWLMSKDNSTAGIIFAMKNCCTWRDNPDTETDDDDTIVGFTGWTDEKTV